MLERIHEGTAGLDCRGDDLGCVDRLDLELDLPARDPRHVEQIVDKPDELPELATDHLDRPFELRRILLAHLQDVHGIADRGQRVAQLVRQHR